jgi:hypothetical protein
MASSGLGAGQRLVFFVDALFDAQAACLKIQDGQTAQRADCRWQDPTYRSLRADVVVLK